MSEPAAATTGFRYEESRRLAERMCHALVTDSGLNAFLEQTAHDVARCFGSSRLCLVDYNEHTDRFVLLYFLGYPADARHLLQRRMDTMELRRALREREPYQSRTNPHFLAIPCSFHEDLESVVVVERETPGSLSGPQQEAARLVSRYFGLFMSSTRLEVNRDRLLDSQDLHRARQIQLRFLPGELPHWPGCEVYGLNQASQVVGGDYYDYFEAPAGILDFILADACGHGMAAALIMSNFRGLLQAEVGRRPDPAALFELLNAKIHTGDDLIQYLTAVLLCYERESRRLEYANAGHFDPLVIDAQGGLRSLPGGGPPLGMFRNSTYPLGVCILHPGDLLVLFSDGLVDAPTPGGDYLGVEGLSEILREFRNFSLPEMASRVMERVREFTGGIELEDDVTLFLLRVT
jgi:sigma-B regulation protein RsbU (phosphoserine phosphatase)